MADIEDIDFSALVEDTEPEGRIRNMKVFDGKEYYLTVRLSDLVGATIIEHEDEDTGKPCRGVFLPFKDAGLTVTPKKNVLLVCKAELAQLATKKYTHLLTQITEREVWQERNRLGFKQGFIGFMRPAEKKKKF
jgi:hypothetical protein